MGKDRPAALGFQKHLRQHLELIGLKARSGVAKARDPHVGLAPGHLPGDELGKLLERIVSKRIDSDQDARGLGQIGDADNIGKYIQRVKDKDDYSVLFGFGLYAGCTWLDKAAPREDAIFWLRQNQAWSSRPTTPCSSGTESLDRHSMIFLVS